MKANLVKNTKSRVLTLADVRVDQPFVTKNGDLAFKLDYVSYVIIASSEGSPLVDHIDCPAKEPIKKVLPEVESWEF